MAATGGLLLGDGFLPGQGCMVGLMAVPNVVAKGVRASLKFAVREMRATFSCQYLTLPRDYFTFCWYQWSSGAVGYCLLIGSVTYDLLIDIEPKTCVYICPRYF